MKLAADRRYRRQGQLNGPLVRQLVVATLPGVVIGATIRVYVLPGQDVFRLVAAAVLLPLGIWLWHRTLTRRTATRTGRPLSRAVLAGLALAVGIVGGIYGIGGGSILGPILVGTGLPVARVAPAALASTFLTSIVGAATYALLAFTTSGAVAPDWPLGLACGLGGLIGGYLGARLQPHMPDTALTLILGTVAITPRRHLRHPGPALNRLEEFSQLAAASHTAGRIRWLGSPGSSVHWGAISLRSDECPKWTVERHWADRAARTLATQPEGHHQRRGPGRRRCGNWHGGWRLQAAGAEQRWL